MITGKLMVVAEGVVRDVETNLVSIHNIVDELAAEGFPLFVNKLTALTVLERTATDNQAFQGTMVVTIGDLKLARAPIAVSFLDSMRANVILRVQGLVIPNPGEVTFTLYEANSIGSTTGETDEPLRKIIETKFLAKARRSLSMETSSSIPSSPS